MQNPGILFLASITLIMAWDAYKKPYRSGQIGLEFEMILDSERNRGMLLRTALIAGLLQILSGGSLLLAIVCVLLLHIAESLSLMMHSTSRVERIRALLMPLKDPVLVGKLYDLSKIPTGSESARILSRHFKKVEAENYRVLGRRFLMPYKGSLLFIGRSEFTGPSLLEPDDTPAIDYLESLLSETQQPKEESLTYKGRLVFLKRTIA